MLCRDRSAAWHRFGSRFGCFLLDFGVGLRRICFGSGRCFPRSLTWGWCLLLLLLGLLFRGSGLVGGGSCLALGVCGAAVLFFGRGPFAHGAPLALANILDLFLEGYLLLGENLHSFLGRALSWQSTFPRLYSLAASSCVPWQPGPPGNRAWSRSVRSVCRGCRGSSRPAPCRSARCPHPSSHRSRMEFWPGVLAFWTSGCHRDPSGSCSSPSLGTSILTSDPVSVWISLSIVVGLA